MCLVRSLLFLPFVRLVVLLFLIRRGRLSCWVLGLTVSSHETLLSCHRPVTLGLHSVALPLEHVRLSGICWILIQMVEWTRLVASLCSFRRLLLFLLQNWVVSFVDCCVVVSFRSSGGLQRWLQFSKVPYRRLSATIGRFRLHQFCRRFLKAWSLCVLVVYLERSGVLPSHQYSYRKRLGTCDALLDIVCAGQLELDRGGELALVQIDFSAAFDRVNHGGLVFKLREAGVGGLILRVFQNFLSSRTQRVKVDGVFSSSIDVVSDVPQGSVLGPLLFLLYIADLPRLLQNELVGYADDSTLLCRIPHPRDRSSVAASLNEDLAVISNWCSRWGMLVNPSKTRGMLISRSRTVEPSFPDLLIDGSVVEMVSELKILGVIIDSKLSFEKQVRAIAASASMRVGILRKTMSVFRDVTVVAKCFWAFILPVLEYCSPVWMSAATSHLSLLDRVVSQVGRLSGGSVSCDLWHRRRVASLSAFFNIDSLVDHPVRGLFPAQYVLRRPTRGALAAHSRSFEMPRSRTVQFSRSFVLSCVRLWNGLHESVFAGEGLGAFKTSVNRFLLQGWLPTVSSFSSTVSLSFFLFSGPKIAWGSSDL